MNIISSSLEQSLILLPLILGMHLSYRLLKLTDLTVDATFVLGTATFALSIDFGLIPALMLSIIAGGLTGIVVAFMQRNDKVGSLIAGILAGFMLYSINLQLMGRPNISILDKTTLLNLFSAENWLVPLAIINVFIIISLVTLLKSNLGLTLRAFGHNKQLLSILGKRSENYRMLGLMLSNALAALSGALSAQVNGFADINMGFGVALISIGAVVIGTHIFIKDNESFKPVKEVLSCFAGIMLYFICLSFLLKIGINPLNLKLILGAVIFLSLRGLKRVTK